MSLCYPSVEGIRLCEVIEEVLNSSKETGRSDLQVYIYYEKTRMWVRTVADLPIGQTNQKHVTLDA